MTSGVWRFVRLQLGLFVFGYAIALMLEAHIGLDPWSAFHEGAGALTGLSFGRITQLTGLSLVAIGWFALKVRPGWGTVFNMLLVGPWIDLIRAQRWVLSWNGGLEGTVQFLVGIVVLGLATAVYIGANLGAGPRDGFVLGLAQRSGRSVRSIRIVIELTVLATGWAIGGSIGLGTVLFALLMGPSMQAGLRLFRVRTPTSKPSPPAPSDPSQTPQSPPRDSGADSL